MPVDGLRRQAEERLADAAATYCQKGCGRLMSIVKMKRLRIFGMASDCEELLRKLQHLGCVELRAPTQPSSDPGWQGFTAKSDGELANAQLRMDEFRTTLER